MDIRNKAGDKTHYDNPDDSASHVAEAASELLNESKKFANEIYENGLHRVGEAQDNIKEYSDELVKKVKENPLSAILIAGGVGFLLASILKK